MIAARPRAVALLAALALVAATAAVLASRPAPADAAPRQASGSTIRVAHFSPDTPPMDVYAAGFDGAESLVLPKLGFGEVSQYLQLPSGTYAFSMRPHGSPATSTAALRVSADLAGGHTYTFAAFGRQDGLQTDLLDDDLTAPPAGAARVRLIQAAGDSGPVDVSTSAPSLFASAADLATVGPYAAVPAGAVEVTASADGVDDVAQRLDLAAGTVSSVVVLDDPAGGLQVVRVTDGTGTAGGVATPTGMPAGGVDTGGGSTASVTTGAGGVPAAVAAAVGALAVAGAASLGALLIPGRRVRRRPAG